MNGKILCRVLTGPTATGKSELAVRFAEETGSDIISMDSMQIYRGMNIGTAKIPVCEQHGIRHWMLDIVDPKDEYSVSSYRDDAEKLIRQLHSEGRNILFVGGTGLYLHAMIHPVAMGSVPADPELREALHSLAEKPGGKEQLHAELEKIDPETASRLPVNDIRRVIRAIEVTRITGIPFSIQPARDVPSPFEWRIASAMLERNELYERINQRVDVMITKGLADEVRGLLDSGVPENAQSMSGIGYKEMIPYIKGCRKLSDAADDIKTASRHYAKRQITFLKRENEVSYFDASDHGKYEKLKEVLL